MGKRCCAACGHRFAPRAQVPGQRYCSAAACQRERRRRWQQSKRREDADYRANQDQAQRQWAQRHRDYWRRYRQGHPEYTERNRQQQQRRNQQRRAPVSAVSERAQGIAKRDVSAVDYPVLSGTYYLIPCAMAADCKEGRVNSKNRFLIQRLE